ncbi:MAG: GNAT family N-acetyltransferase [Promethearchaeota archaeon]
MRNFEPTDWENLLEISQEYEKSDMGKYDQEYPQTPEEMKEVVELLGSGDEFAAVILKSQPKVIGLVQFQRKKDFVDEVILGLGGIFNSDFQGKGYAFEAFKIVLDYLFEELEIDRCTAGTAVVNNKSRSLVERLGFREVTQKQVHFRKDSNGNPINFMYVIYEFSRKDWEG